MDIFNWEELKQARSDGQPTRDKIIDMAFDQYAEGNDLRNTLSSPELQAFYETFRTAWLISELLIKK